MSPVYIDLSEPASSGYFIFHGDPGSRLSNSVRVTNVGNAPGTVFLSAVDAVTGQSSGTSFLASTDPKHDVGAWTTLSIRELTLAPGQSQDVPFYLTIPNPVRPGQHGGGLIAETETSLSANGTPTTIQVQQRIALGILVNIPGSTVDRLEASSIRYDTNSTYQRVLVGLSNTGTQLLHPSGNLQIYNTSNQLLQDIPIKMDTFIPQTSIDYPVYIVKKVLPVGTYTAILHLNYEIHNSLTYTAMFTVTAPAVVHPTQTFHGVLSSLVQPDQDTIKNYIIAGLVFLILAGGLYIWGRKTYIASRRTRKMPSVHSRRTHIASRRTRKMPSVHKKS